jgi:glycosyltransferase involved in cell wall biosynthesis
MHKISILTRATGISLLARTCKNIVHRILGHKFHLKTIGGPSSVLQSLLSGLKELKIEHNVNPKLASSLYNNVIVLSNIEALKQAIFLKRKGVIKKLLAGPNLVVLPHEENGILTSPEIDICIVPCKWVQDIYEEDAPSLRNKIRIWPAGIDHVFWKPKSDYKKEKTLLIYKKNDPLNLASNLVAIAQHVGWKTKTLDYGSYKKEEYKKALDESSLSVFLSLSESQGIALLEAWSMNIPTLVWNPVKRSILNKKNVPVSSAPYLTEETGKLWNSLEGLQKIFQNYNELKSLWTPRKWVLENMTNQVSTKKLLSILKENR